MYDSNFVPPPRTPNPAQNADKNKHQQSPAESFRRGIKREIAIFPTLKDEKLNDKWHRSMMTQARAQGVDDVLDLAFVPRSLEDRELFAEKQKFLYAVLEQKVLTDKGKDILREFEVDGNAQKVYGKLKKHHLNSTNAAIDNLKLLTYITSAKLGNGEWRGTTAVFILHGQNQVRLYKRQVPKESHFTEGIKRNILKNAVQAINDLRCVKVTAI